MELVERIFEDAVRVKARVEDMLVNRERLLMLAKRLMEAEEPLASRVAEQLLRHEDVDHENLEKLHAFVQKIDVYMNNFESSESVRSFVSRSGDRDDFEKLNVELNRIFHALQLGALVRETERVGQMMTALRRDKGDMVQLLAGLASAPELETQQRNREQVSGGQNSQQRQRDRDRDLRTLHGAPPGRLTRPLLSPEDSTSGPGKDAHSGRAEQLVKIFRDWIVCATTIMDGEALELALTFMSRKASTPALLWDMQQDDPNFLVETVEDEDDRAELLHALHVHIDTRTDDSTQQQR